MDLKFRGLPAAVLAFGLLALPGAASAQVMKETFEDLDAFVVVDERLQTLHAAEPMEDAEAVAEEEVRGNWHAFLQEAGSEWKGHLDKRSGRLEFAEGAGIPWVPGRGNKLKQQDIAAHLGAKAKPDLQSLDSVARAFLPKVAKMLGVDKRSLVLDRGRSGQPDESIWFLDYNVEMDGLRVEGARVVFRVNHGNLIQFGSENLPPAHVSAPKAKLARAEALSALSAYLGGFHATDTFVDAGSLRLLPTADKDFEPGRGRGLAAAWEFTFRREGQNGTWRARVDARSGDVLEFVDVNHYAQATGAAKILGTATNLPMPFTNLSTGGFTNSAGLYTFGGGALTSSLNGQYVRILDNCGTISLAADGSGNLNFGTSTGTNCTTPGVGGLGNTHSARTQFYHLNRAKEIARGWLPTNTWLNGQLTANVNINLTCNAFWNGSSVNFYRSGGGCGNTGEIEGVALHEYGHGLDSNDGNGSAPDNGTGETYGDWTAALATHTSCIGPGFLTSNCGGYGDACTACTGVRDIDYAKHALNTPSTAANFIQTKCPTHAFYRGPCGKEGHCESLVSSQALWDFVNRDLPNPGSGTAWAIADRLWYLSRSTATAAFSCTAGTTYTSNGCNTGSLWRTLRAVDDDDGNLANGTPNSAALYAAFNRHGIACTSDAGANVSFRGCTQPATPTLTLTPGANQVGASWTNSGTGVVYDVYKNESGCNAGFIKVANNLTGTSYTDTAAANGFTYYYQVVAHPSATEACGAAPTTCQSATPSGGTCTPPAAPAGLTATASGTTQINLAWSPVVGATEYRIYRAATSGGPYTQVGTSTTPAFSNTGLTCNTAYFYVVRAFAGCESVNSTQATATTATCGGGGCTTTTLYTNGFEAGTGITDWAKGTFLSGGSTADWRGIQTCTAKTGTKVFRFGSSLGCTSNYASNAFTYAQPNGTGGIAVPAGSTTSRLSFWHRRDFESGYDGGTLAVSVDGTNYTYVPASAILSGSYNGTAATGSGACPPAGAGGAAIFTGTSSTFTNTVVDLDAACNAATGTTTGCAGRAVRIGFTSITDCSVTGDGWFLDDVTVTACTP